MLAKVVQGTDGDMTLQSMVFEPANRVIYLATGLDAPSPTHYERIDLKYYFERSNWHLAASDELNRRLRRVITQAISTGRLWGG